MTRKEAIEECKKHWEWLRDNPDSQKSEYEPSENWIFKCAACEFCITNRLSCNNCIIPWPKSKNDNRFCTSPLSPYYHWSPGDTENAQKIINLCNQALEELKIHGCYYRIYQ